MVLFVSFISTQASFAEPEPHEICAEAIKAIEVLWKGHSDLFTVNINVVGWQQGDAQEREFAQANADISADPPLTKLNHTWCVSWSFVQTNEPSCVFLNRVGEPHLLRYCVKSSR
jgi:hypothetical protein